MPEAVKTFVVTKQINSFLRLQRDIVHSYEDDMVKYADDADKPLIKKCFQSIPKQLSKQHKKILAHPEKYHIAGAIKLGDYNVGRSERMLTIPLYMGFMLTEF